MRRAHISDVLDVEFKRLWCGSVWAATSIILARHLYRHACFSGKEELAEFAKQIKTGGGSPPLYLLSSALQIFFALARLGRFLWFDAIYALLTGFISFMILTSAFI